MCVVFDISYFLHIEEQKQSRILQQFQLQLTEMLQLYSWYCIKFYWKTLHKFKRANTNASKPIKQNRRAMAKIYRESLTKNRTRIVLKIIKPSSDKIQANEMERYLYLCCYFSLLFENRNYALNKSRYFIYEMPDQQTQKSKYCEVFKMIIIFSPLKHISTPWNKYYIQKFACTMYISSFDCWRCFIIKWIISINS